VRFANDTEKALEDAKAWLDRFSVHLTEAGLGQVSEIFDGDAPHQARGCIAQAWSVAELLRLAKMVNRRSHVTPFKAEPAQRSDESDYVTGIALFVDSGMTLYPGFASGG
jgi:glycogen debranching enzyme